MVAALIKRTTIMVAILKTQKHDICEDCDHGRSNNKDTEIEHFCEDCESQFSIHQQSAFSKRFAFFEAINAEYLRFLPLKSDSAINT